MSAARNGKIARLPKPIRDDLGPRIENGEQGKELVEWLNGLPAVQDVLKEQFGGHPVNEQNLSEWMQGGYPEWLRQQETRSLVSKLAEQSDDFDEAADGQEVSSSSERACRRDRSAETPSQAKPGPLRPLPIKPNQT
jgi:hypothetical protein